MTARRRLISRLSRLERRLSVRNLLLALAVLGSVAAALGALAVVLLLATSADALGFQVAAAGALLFGGAAAAAYVALQALSFRRQARMELQLSAVRTDLRRGASAEQLSRLETSTQAATKDVLTSMRALGLGVQSGVDHAVEQQREMLTSVLEAVLQQGDAASPDGLVARITELKQQLDAAQLKTYRQVEALMSVHSVLPVRAPLPQLGDWAVSPDAAASLISLVLDTRPRLVVELGSGVSTVLVGYALQQCGGGRLLAFEHDETFAEKTRHDLTAHGLDEVARVVSAPLVQQQVEGTTYTWYDLSGLDADAEIDLLFVDGPPATTGPLARYPAVPLLWDRLAPDARVVLDDADRPDEQAIVARWLGAHEKLEHEHLAHERGSALLRRRP